MAAWFQATFGVKVQRACHLAQFSRPSWYRRSTAKAHGPLRVTQDEPTNGLGDGDTAVDAVINADGTVLLRAERSGSGDGRVYRISFTASDLEGSTSGVVVVTVPRSPNSAAIDSGWIFNSTQ